MKISKEAMIAYEIAKVLDKNNVPFEEAVGLLVGVMLAMCHEMKVPREMMVMIGKELAKGYDELLENSDKNKP